MMGKPGKNLTLMNITVMTSSCSNCYMEVEIFICWRRKMEIRKYTFHSWANVWSERMLDMLEGKPADLSEEVFVGMVWDGQEVVVGCASGKLLTLPDCTECNKLEETELKELSDLAYCGGFYLLVKPDGETQVLAQDEANVRQYKISIESAREKTEAQFVDVRSKEEYDKGHIEGSIHLDVDKIEELPGSTFPIKRKKSFSVVRKEFEVRRL